MLIQNVNMQYVLIGTLQYLILLLLLFIFVFVLPCLVRETLEHTNFVLSYIKQLSRV